MVYFFFNLSEMRRRQSPLSTRAFLQIRDGQLMDVASVSSVGYLGDLLAHRTSRRRSLSNGSLVLKSNIAFYPYTVSF